MPRTAPHSAPPACQKAPSGWPPAAAKAAAASQSTAPPAPQTAAAYAAGRAAAGFDSPAPWLVKEEKAWSDCGGAPNRAPNRRQASGWRQTRSLISRRMLSLHKRQTGNSKACAGAIYYDEQVTDIRRFSSQIRSPSFLSTYLIAASTRIFVIRARYPSHGICRDI